MATIIKIKRSTGVAAPTAIGTGELAYTYGTGTASNLGDRLFVGTGTETAGVAANIEVIGGKYFSDLLDHAHGVVTADSALIVDTSSKINVLNIDNLKLDGNVISSTNTDGHIELTPNGSGRTVASNLYIGNDSIQEYIEDISGGSVTAGEGIDVTYDDTAGTTTIAGEDATTGNKGIASFNSADFSVSSGAVSIGSLANNQLDNSTVSYGGVQLSLGGSDGTPAFNLADATAYPGDSSLVTVGTLNGFTVAANKTISMGSNRVTNVTDPTSAQDAATKAYVDAVKTGLDIKDSVKVSTTANITIATGLNASDTLDGVTLVNGDRVLVKNQTTTSENGVYIVAATPIRATDFDSSSEVSGGAFTFVEEGNTNADSGWVLTTNGTITVGSTGITFAQFSGAGSFTDGDGLLKTGNVMSVRVDNSSIEITSDILNVKAAGISNGMLAGSIDLTTKVAGILPVANGGLGFANPNSNRLIIGGGTSTMSVLAAGTAGQVLISDGSNAPDWGDIDGGTF